MKKFIFLFFLLLGEISSAQTIACNPKTDPGHWFYGALSQFVAAGGCAVQGSSVKTPLIPAPFFVISKLNLDTIGPVQGNMDISIYNPGTKARTILEKLFAREDVMMIMAPMTDHTGLVLSRETDPETFEALRKQFPDLPNILKIKIVFVLGNAASEVTVIHENQHVDDLVAGRLPLKVFLNKFSEDINANLKNHETVSEEEIELLSSWASTMTRSTPEVSAIQAEYRFLSLQGKAPKKFFDYLKTSDHDFINKNKGIFWLNKSLSDDAKTEFQKYSAKRVCQFLKETYATLNISTFHEIYTNCLELIEK